jgi:hypothetical protein
MADPQLQKDFIEKPTWLGKAPLANFSTFAIEGEHAY